MPFSEQASQYQYLFHQWAALGEQKVDPALADVIDVARGNAATQMNALTPDVAEEFATVAAGTSPERERLLGEFDKIISAADGLLDEETIAAKRAQIMDEFPDQPEAEQTFAQAYVVGHALVRPLLGAFLANEDRKTAKELSPSARPVEGPAPAAEAEPTPVAPAEPTLEPTEPAAPAAELAAAPVAEPEQPQEPKTAAADADQTNPEQEPKPLELSTRHALFLVGTLVGRRERLAEIRAVGIEVPDESDLDAIFDMLFNQMDHDEAVEVLDLLTETSEENEHRVRFERETAAAALWDMLQEKDAMSAQFDRLIKMPGTTDARCLVLDFLDGIDPAQHPYLRDLLSRVADLTTPITNMTGRVVDRQASPIEIAPLRLVTNEKEPELEASDEQQPVAEVKPTRSAQEILAEEVTIAIEGDDSLLSIFKQYGYQLDANLNTHELRQFPTITYTRHTQAKKINGLLDARAQQADSKATYRLQDLIALAVYSARPEMFDALVGLTQEELQERHDTTARTLNTIIRAKLAELVAATEVA